ncbi:transposase [Anaerotalea alkaliphila]|uniref:Transposase n=1 Tax=Anaerotalea alkaliphila TaxID=2662126 RepID=A0A7X5KMD3_9FIRM|nr:transposase [Anaerotalea alkaliphila]NDL66588.1 transposase [Anaerotalea alkaliphila]
MARQARVKDAYGIYHVHQQGGLSRNLFLDDEDRAYFLSLLQKAQQNFQCRIYAYCMLADNEYHLVLDVNGGDLSKIMKSINIRYAMHAKCDGHLFKDRYRSTLLSGPEALARTVQSVHAKASLAGVGLWNSFCTYNLERPLELGRQMDSGGDCPHCIQSLEEADARLDQVAKDLGTTRESLVRNKAQRNLLIMDFRKNSTLSLKELGLLFGGLSESSVCKILNKSL